MIPRLSSLLALVLLLLAMPLYAQDAESEEKAMTEEASERFHAQLQESEERLQLTDEQKETVRPILEDAYGQRQAVLQKHGVDLESTEKADRPGRRTLRRMRNDLYEVNKETKRKLQDVLTSQQMNQWEELQEERRAKMRAQLLDKS